MGAEWIRLAGGGKQAPPPGTVRSGLFGPLWQLRRWTVPASIMRRQQTAESASSYGLLINTPCGKQSGAWCILVSPNINRDGPGERGTAVRRQWRGDVTARGTPGEMSSSACAALEAFVCSSLSESNPSSHPIGPSIPASLRQKGEGARVCWEHTTDKTPGACHQS